MLRREPDPLLLTPAELRAGMLRREPDPLLLSPGLPSIPYFSRASVLKSSMGRQGKTQ